MICVWLSYQSKFVSNMRDNEKIEPNFQRMTTIENIMNAISIKKTYYSVFFWTKVTIG